MSRLDQQKNQYRALDHWFNTPQGQHVGDALGVHLASMAERLQGTTLLQLGLCGANTWLGYLRFHRKWITTPCLDANNTSLIASPEALPLGRNSVDCVIAPFLMEIGHRDTRSLDEIDRILKPMGYIIFWGINPFSLWGLLLRTGHLKCFGHTPITPMSSFVLKQILSRRGYSACLLDTFYYTPPVTQTSLIERLSFLDQMGKMISPLPAGFYCLIVQKYKRIPPNFIFQQKPSRITIPNGVLGLTRDQAI